MIITLSTIIISIMIESQDFFPQDIIGQGRDNLISTLGNIQSFETLQNINWPRDISFYLNLVWPGKKKIDIIPAQHILISFHTEQMDVDWLKQVGDRFSNSRIIVLYDGYVEFNDWWPENIVFIRYVTWHHQISIMVDQFGPIKTIADRKYKASSLVHRESQYKTLLTGWILSNKLEDQFIMSWHKGAIESSDTHVYQSTGDFYLDFLARYMSRFDKIIEPDIFDSNLQNPIYNSNWHYPAYENSVINFTNESFHYTLGIRDGKEFKYPGVYLTEKTWKPLIAGCGLLAVGQQNTYRALEQLGFKFDYGIDLSYDKISGDIERFINLLVVAEKLIGLDINELNEMIRPSADHNQQHILNGTCTRACNNLNHTNLMKLESLL